MSDTKQKKKTGRPILYPIEQVIEKSNIYYDKCINDESLLPTMEELSFELGMNGDTLNEKIKQSEILSVTTSKILELQKRRLMNNAIRGTWKERMAMFLLNVNHGMQEQTKTDFTSKGKQIGMIGLLNEIDGSNKQE